MVRAELRAGLPQEGADPVRLHPALVAGVEEPVHHELELEVAQPVVVEQRLHLGERARLEDVLEVGVPEPDPAEADPRRLRAAVAQVEEAPLAAHVDLDRAGDRPVETEQVVAGHRARQSNLWTCVPTSGMISLRLGCKRQRGGVLDRG